MTSFWLFTFLFFLETHRRLKTFCWELNYELIINYKTLSSLTFRYQITKLTDYETDENENKSLLIIESHASEQTKKEDNYTIQWFIRATKLIISSQRWMMMTTRTTRSENLAISARRSAGTSSICLSMNSARWCRPIVGRWTSQRFWNQQLHFSRITTVKYTEA